MQRKDGVNLSFTPSFIGTPKGTRTPDLLIRSGRILVFYVQIIPLFARNNIKLLIFRTLFVSIYRVVYLICTTIVPRFSKSPTTYFRKVIAYGIY